MPSQRVADLTDFISRLDEQDMGKKLARNVTCWSTKGMSAEIIHDTLRGTYNDLHGSCRAVFRAACVNAYGEIDAKNKELLPAKDALLELTHNMQVNIPANVKRHVPEWTPSRKL